MSLQTQARVSCLQKILDHILKKAQVENAAGASQTDVCKKYLITQYTRSISQRYLKEHQSGECR